MVESITKSQCDLVITGEAMSLKPMGNADTTSARACKKTSSCGDTNPKETIGFEGFLDLKTFVSLYPTCCAAELKRGRSVFNFVKCITSAMPKISRSVFIVSLIYLSRYRKATIHYTSIRCGHCLLLTAIILSSKYLNDFSYVNKDWAKAAELSLSQINMLESYMLKAIKFELFVSPSEHDLWNIQHKVLEAYSSSSPGRIEERRRFSAAGLQRNSGGLACKKSPPLRKYVSPNLKQASHSPGNNGLSSYSCANPQTSGYKSSQQWARRWSSPYVQPPYPSMPSRCRDMYSLENYKITPSMSEQNTPTWDGYQVNTAISPFCANRAPETYSPYNHQPCRDTGDLSCVPSAYMSTNAALDGISKSNLSSNSIEPNFTNELHPSPFCGLNVNSSLHVKQQIRYQVAAASINGYTNPLSYGQCTNPNAMTTATGLRHGPCMPPDIMAEKCTINETQLLPPLKYDSTKFVNSDVQQGLHCL
eukprot:Nk52_evm10s2171 gene=Nk52_evmTU10s2171